MSDFLKNISKILCRPSLKTWTPSHKDMNEIPRKRLSDPPNSATREVQG